MLIRSPFYGTLPSLAVKPSSLAKWYSTHYAHTSSLIYLLVLNVRPRNSLEQSQFRQLLAGAFGTGKLRNRKTSCINTGTGVSPFLCNCTKGRVALERIQIFPSSGDGKKMKHVWTKCYWLKYKSQNLNFSISLCGWLLRPESSSVEIDVWGWLYGKHFCFSIREKTLETG